MPELLGYASDVLVVFGHSPSSQTTLCNYQQHKSNTMTVITEMIGTCRDFMKARKSMHDNLDVKTTGRRHPWMKKKTRPFVPESERAANSRRTVWESLRVVCR